MLRRPRRFKYERQYRCRLMRALFLNINTNWTINICTRTNILLDWYAFERIRLHLSWGLGRRRKSSRKYFFKKKKIKKLEYVHLGGRLMTTYSNKLFWYKGFPHLSYTNKPRGARMGRGKGQIKGWYYLLRPGQPFICLRYFNSQKLYYLINQLCFILPGALFKAPIKFNFKIHYI